ncbi:hypothetical protein C3Z06_30770 (plasmid) [Cupriavidus metallidurans]|nr:hypothetical protein C3Z06_30770 [Cupriavidus metallidurans]
MARKLGVWNRLALVLTVLVTVALPATYLIGELQNQEDYEKFRTTACYDRQVLDDRATSATLTTCLASIDTALTTRKEQALTRGLPLMIGIGFGLCVLTYCCIWTCVAVVRWILRGRKTS